MKIDSYASWAHYWWHATPIWRALPDDLRGVAYAPRDVINQCPNADLVEGLPDRRSSDPVLVAGFADAHTVRPRPTILVNHGAGQSYKATKAPASFSGGPGRERVLLHLEPGPLAARASAAAGHTYAEVGMAAMDPWHHTRPIPQRGLIAIALHHNGRGAPEQMSAFTHFEPGFKALATDGLDVVGHGHPRGWERTQNRWRQLGIPAEPSLIRVLDEAALLITDISSAGPMFASTGRPVVWISAPWHTAAPESGGRFHHWTRTVDPVRGHVTDPEELADIVRHHLFHPSRLVAAQQPIVDDVFAYTDGQAAQRAAAEIVKVLGVG